MADPIEDAVAGELDHFLTARWALVTRRGNQLLYGAVHHPRWPLHRVADVEICQSAIEAAGLPAPVGPPHGRYSPGVNVQIAWFEKMAHREVRRSGEQLGQP